MDQNPNTTKPTSLDQPFRASGQAGLSFFSDTLISILSIGGIKGLYNKIVKSGTFGEGMKTMLTNKFAWAGAVGFGLWSAKKGYDAAKSDQQAYSQLKEDNAQMRAQLDQTGAVLSTVAEKIENAKSYASRETPNATHAEKIAEQNVAKAEAGHTIH